MQDANVKQLIAWFVQQGGRAPAVALCKRGGLRGMFAQRDIGEGEVVLHAPRHVVLTLHGALNSPLGLRLLTLPLSVESMFAVFLLQTRRRGDYWKPMVDAMPASFAGLPIHFNRADWDLLDASGAQRRAGHRAEVIRRDHKAINKALLRADRFTLREFTWAWWAAATRGFGLSIHGKHESGMVPFADMLNHSQEPNATWAGDHSRGMDVKALRRIRKGEEITISYGTKANTEWLASYGFCVEDDLADTVTLAFGLPKGHFLPQMWPTRYPRGASLGFTVDRNPEGKAVRRMFSFLRLCSLPDHAAARALPETSESDGERVPALGADNEREALELLTASCEMRLREYPTTLEEDERLLAQGLLSARQRFAVMARSGEKRVLLDYIQMSHRARAALAMDGEARREALAQAIARGGPFRAYFEHLRDRLAAGPGAMASAAEACALEGWT
jgi:hypothetical protein